jgi:uncharacterized protein YlzI (FlbEa/FlbD family)
MSLSYDFPANHKIAALLKRCWLYVNLSNVSGNPVAIDMLKASPWMIDWASLSSNPAAIGMLEANPDKINWASLSSNPEAIDMLEANPDKIYWYNLSTNPAAIELLKANPDKIDWQRLSTNPAAIDMLEANPDKIDWQYLSTNPAAIDMLKANPNKIDWFWLSSNPAAIELLKANPDKINWGWLSSNPAAIDMLKASPWMIDWQHLSQNPAAIDMLESNPTEIDWQEFSHCYWCPYRHKDLLNSIDHGVDELEKAQIQAEHVRYKEEIEQVGARHREALQRISEEAMMRRADAKAEQIRLAKEARRLEEQKVREAMIEIEVQARFAEEVMQQEVERRLQDCLAALEPVATAVPSAAHSAMDMVARFDSIQSGLHGAHEIHVHQRRD